MNDELHYIPSGISAHENTGLIQLVNTVPYWRRLTPAGVTAAEAVRYGAYKMHNTQLSEYTDIVTKEQFLELHPGLQPLLDTMDSGMGLMYTSQLRGTLHYLRNPDHLVLPVHAFLAPCIPDQEHHVTAMKKIEKIRSGKTAMKFCYYHYKLETAANGGIYVTGLNTEKRQVSVKWLDTAFPGWRDRFELAEALGLDPAAQAGFVLSGKEPIPSCAVPVVELA